MQCLIKEFEILICILYIYICVCTRLYVILLSREDHLVKRYTCDTKPRGTYSVRVENRHKGLNLQRYMHASTTDAGTKGIICRASGCRIRTRILELSHA